MSLNAIPKVKRSENLKNIKGFIKDPMNVFSRYHEKYGQTYILKDNNGRNDIWVTTHPGFIQHIFQKNHKNYCKPPIQIDELGRLLGQGLLTIDGDYWLKQRRLIQPGFHKKKLDALTNMVNGIIKNNVEDWKNNDAVLKDFPLHKEMTRMTFEIVLKSLFSETLTKEEMSYLSDVIADLQRYLTKRTRLPFLIPFFKISGYDRKKMKLSKDAKQHIRDAIKRRQEGAERHDDLLDMLIEARYEDTGEGMNDKQLLDESLILIVAGHETTANALVWINYLLSKNPDVVERIREESKELVQNDSLTLMEVIKMKYTSAVIEEAMRLYPPAWITGRMAVEDDEFDGHKIPKSTVITSYIYGVHHDKRNWEDPEVFRPERFMTKDNKRNPFCFMPFGGGPRLCIGNSFAMMEMQLVVAHLVNEFDYTLKNTKQPELEPQVTLSPKDEIFLGITKR